MKQSLIVLVLTISWLLLITGSAIATSVAWNPIPISEPAVMLLFGITLIGTSVAGKKPKRAKNN